MFDVDFFELAVVGVVALLVVGPKDLPKLMRVVGQWMGRARGMARHVRSGFDTMVRESEIEELNKRWEQQNADIMAATQVDTWIDSHDGPATRPDPADRPLMTPTRMPAPALAPALPTSHLPGLPTTQEAPAALNGVAVAAPPPAVITLPAPPAAAGKPPAGQLA